MRRRVLLHVEMCHVLRDIISQDPEPREVGTNSPQPTSWARKVGSQRGGVRGEARGQLASVVKTGREPRPLIQA